MERVTSSPDNGNSILDDMPTEILLEMPFKKCESTRRVLIRYLHIMGRKLYSAHHKKSNSRDNILHGCETLFDRHFACPDLSIAPLTTDAIVTYLQPLTALLNGVADQCDIVYGIDTYDKGSSPMVAFGLSVHQTLQLLTGMTVYTAVPHDDREFLSDVLETFRDTLMARGMIQRYLEIYIKTASIQSGVEKSSALFEQQLWYQCKPCKAHSLYLTLMSALGESMHKSDIRSPFRGDEVENVSRVFISSLDKTLPSRSTDMYISECSSHYLKATFVYVLAFMKKNQYRIPKSLIYLPERLDQVSKNPSSVSIVCPSNFVEMVTHYHQQVEIQIMNAVVSLNSKDVSKEELSLLNDSSILLDSLHEFATLWNLDSGSIKVNINIIAFVAFFRSYCLSLHSNPF